VQHLNVSDDVGDLTKTLGTANFVSLDKNTDCHNECIRRTILSFDNYDVVAQVDGRSIVGLGIFNPAVSHLQFPDQEVRH